MQKNQNNVENKNQINFKSLVDFFQSNQINLTSNEKDKNNKKTIYISSENIKNKLINNEIIKVQENNQKMNDINLKNNSIKQKKQNKNEKGEVISTNQIFLEDDGKLKEKISKLKTDVISLLNDSMNQINSKYQKFSTIIIDWHKTQNLKLAKLIKEKNQNINSTKIKLTEKIQLIFQMHENLISCLKDQLSLLDSFLSDNFFDINFPVEEFIVKNSGLIINGNFLAKIDMKKIYLNKIFENKELYEIFQNYYLKRKNNFSQLKSIKIKIKSINDLVSTNDKIHQIKNKETNFADKINSISFDHLNLSSFPIKKIEMNNLKNLEKFKIKKCMNLYNTYIYESILTNSNNLKIIKLEYILLTDKSFNEFILKITKINSLIKSIKYLSFSHNYLSSITLKTRKLTFENLEMLDFSSNNIYNFSSNNFRILPRLKILDLSDNNINNNLLFEGILKSKKNNLINFIAFMSKNIFLYNVNDNNQKYITYLNTNLPDLDYNLKKINLSFLYNQYNHEEISKLSFSPSIKISLVKLNLSFCGLKDTYISKFFSNNFDLLNLKNLNLHNNFLSVNFFSLFEDKNKLILIDKLEKIDLSFNSIKCQNKDDLEKLNIFIENHKFLKILKLQNNNILKIFRKNEDLKEYNNEINKLVNISEKRNIIIEVQGEIMFSTDNERFKKILLYKSKY